METKDHFLHEVGSCGIFQVFLGLAIIATVLCSVWGMLLMAFGSYNPGWVCLDDAISHGQDVFNISALQKLDKNHTVTSEQLPNTCDVFKACSNISFLPGSSTVVTEWRLLCDDQWVPSVIFTIQMAGVMLGAYVSGMFGDSIGRRLSLYGMVALHAVTNFAAVFSPSWKVFTAIRFFIGIAVGGILALMGTYPTEFLSQAWRGRYAAVPKWNIGSCTFAIAVWLLRDWKQIHLAAASISAILFLPFFWVPESFRWLAARGRIPEAERVAKKIARVNGKPPPSEELLKTFTGKEMELAESEDSKRRYSYLDLFRHKRVCKYTVIMGTIWVCMAFVYYGISFGIQALSGDFYVNFLIFSVAEIPGCVTVIPALNVLGRRWGSAVHFIVIASCCIAVLPVTLLLDDKNDEEKVYFKGKVIMGLALTAKMSIVGVWQIVTVYGGELYPTVVRSLGFGYLNSASRLGAILSPVLFPSDPAYLHIVFTGVGILMLGCAGLSLALPETKGTPLVDTLITNKTIVVTTDGKIIGVDESGVENEQILSRSESHNKLQYSPLKPVADIV